MKHYGPDIVKRVAGVRAGRTRWRGCAAALAALVAAALARPAAAALRIEVIAAPNFVVDSNVGTPASQSPRAAYLSAKIWNDGSTPLTNVFAYIGNYAGGTNSTPGIYPTRTNPFPLTGSYALTHEGGSAGAGDAIRYLGTIQPGEYATVYWLVSYPLLAADGKTPVFGSGPDPSDDLWLNYDIWATSGQGGSALTANQTSRATLRNEISAMANKILPNTANQVPQQYKDLLNAYAPAWTNIASDGSIGSQIYAEGIWYQLGNVGGGYDADNNLIPDQDVWLQPVGNPALFDPSAFRLVQTHVMLVVSLKGGGEQVILADDQLYFKDLPDNNSVVGFVRYEFVPLKAGAQSQLTPYQEAASGSNNLKFNGDYGALLGNGLVSQPSSAGLTKSAGVSNAAPGATIPYAIAFTNTGSVSIGDPALGIPLVIQDRVPAGTRYVAGSAASANTPPAGMSDYTILYSTNNAASWLTSEPVAATNITDIQWWLTGSLPPGGSGIVRFSVQVNDPYQQAPLVVNTAGLGIGNSTPFATATASTLISGNNTLGDRVWADSGSGGGTLGNRIQDGTEPGLSNITVNLYYDANTNGTVDAGDLFVGSAVSSTNGAYLFTNLVDGAYVAVVDAADPDLPAGFTITTPGTVAVELDPARANANPVNVLTADFGFAPALSLTKRQVTAGPVYEARQVTYALTVTNNLPGDGVGGGLPIQYTVWATNLVSATTGWVSPLNALGAPDNNSSTDDFSKSKNDTLVVSLFNLGATVGNVTNVTFLVPIQLVGSINGSITFSLKSGATTFFTTNIADLSTMSSGTQAFNVTASRAWTWSDFTNNSFTVAFDAQKGQGSGGGGTIGIDAAGFLITSTATYGGASGTTTLNPVPLRDTFDTALLQYVSASPAPTSVTTNGTVGTVYWSNVGPVYPGGSQTATVTFRGLEPPNNASDRMVTNTAVITNAFFSGGRPANPATSQVFTNLQPTGVIGDFVWRDQNRDGSTNGEIGIANVKVVLTPPAGVDAGAGPGVAITNTTDLNGYYQFTGLANTGRYVIAVLTASLPNGGVGVTNTYTEMSGTISPTNITVVTNLFPAATDGSDKRLGADFGYAWAFTTIDGLVWNDLNRSATATADSGEYGLTNVTVYLYNATNSLVPVATNRTDATGYFAFSGNYTGTFFIVVTTNTGPLSGGTSWTPTFDTDGLSSTSRVTIVGVTTGATYHVDFSYYQTGPYAIGDTLYYDWNGNGVQNAGEEGIPNVLVQLYWDSNSNGVVDAGADVLMVATNTDALGRYLFTNAPAGNYLVVVPPSTNLPPLFTLTGDPYGAKDGVSLVTLFTGSNTNQDFGYQPQGTGSIGDTVWRDLNADGVQSGPQETGITNVTVWLYADMNRDGVYVLLTNTVTDASGMYLFSALPDGRYQVVVDAAGASLPRDSFDTAFVPTTATNALATISGGSSVLSADFGFAALGAIGDTIFFDNNANGTQDANEGGITNVTVKLYVDVNSNGVYDVGDTLYATRTTTTNGAYLFTALPRGPYVVMVDSNSPPLAGFVLTAAPALDGQPLTNATPQNIASNLQYGIAIAPGASFMGADFGFRPPGVIGQTVWIDSNGNGVRDAGESGIPNIGLVLSNATMIVTNRTDVEGYYSFANLPDGVYSVRVLTNAVNFPAGLTASYDPDGTNTANLATLIVISGGRVTSVGGVPRTDFDLGINFGYQYAGANSLSGTIGLDGTTPDGVLGTGPSGVSADEVAFGGKTVYLSIWRDANSNGVIDASETVPLGSTQTTAAGDYSFTGLPGSVGSGTNRYIVSLTAPGAHLTLTTTNGATPALSVVAATNSFGEVLSAYQVVAIAATVTNIDFAFKDAWVYDFGDLPAGYGTLRANGGAQNRVLTTPDLHLGATVTTETDGKPSASAALDTGDDGVFSAGFWQTGATGAVLTVTVGKGSGWLVGYVDFNGNGNFLDDGDLVFNQAVATNGGNGAGVYTLPVAVPVLSISAANATTLYARFRLLPDEPAFPELAFSGLADNGETEDYRWDLGAVGDTVWHDVNGNGVRDAGDLPLPGVRVYVDLNSNGVWNAGEPYGLTDADGIYGIGGFPAGRFLVAVDTNTLPAGIVATTDADGAPYGQADVTLTSGQVNTNLDFGYVYLTTIGDRVWEDLNGNGAQDAGEPGLTNVTVRLLNAVSNEVAATVTDLNGAYLFTNLVPAIYLVQFVPPTQHVFTVRDASAVTNDLADSDADPVTGLTDPMAFTTGTTNLTLDAGFFMPARLYGYAYQDKDLNLTRNSGDGSAAGMVVQIWLEGVQVAATNAAADGFYEFAGLVPGTYEVRFFGNTNYLTAIPTNGHPAFGVPARNRAVATASGYAVATYVIDSGHGIGDDVGEPVNAGFTGSGPTSSGIDLRAYQGADGVTVEFVAYDVEEDGTVRLAVLGADGSVVWSGVTNVLAGARYICRFVVPGLVVGGTYNFFVRDEVGKGWSAPGVTVTPFAAEMESLSLTGVTLSFGSLPGREYEIQWVARLGDAWRTVATVEADSDRTRAFVTYPDPKAPSGFFRVCVK